MKSFNEKIRHLDTKLASSTRTVKKSTNESESVISLEKRRDSKLKAKDAKIYRNILSLSDHIYS